MLKIQIISIGKHKDQWVKDSCDHFIKLLKKYSQVELTTINANNIAATLSVSEKKVREKHLLNKEIKSGLLVALTDRGQQYDSISFSKQLEKWQSISHGKINFIIGGPYGLADELLKTSDFQLSLSPLTFSHQLIRPVLLEQLFRAFSIIQGTDYHK